MTDHWIGLELRHLTALRTIAEQGSFKAAARALGYTPSAVSQQIANLERIVGVQVIERERGRGAVSVTEAGRVLLLHLSAIDARLSAARADIEATGSTRGAVRVGACESVGRELLPDILRHFRAAYPDTRVEVCEALAALDLLASLERGVLDLTFSVLPLPEGPFAAKLVLEDPWVLVTPKGADPADLSVPSLIHELSSSPLACFRSKAAVGPALERLGAIGVNADVVWRSDYNDVVQGYAASGLGNALLPRLAVNSHDARTAAIDLGELIPPRQIVIVRHSDRAVNDALETFISLAVAIGSTQSNALRENTASTSIDPRSHPPGATASARS